LIKVEISKKHALGELVAVNPIFPGGAWEGALDQRHHLVGIKPMHRKVGVVDRNAGLSKELPGVGSA
jgi:hypothetical protein